ncbi:MAG: RHS repeat-associated core domain-containing protein [Caldilineaceae bacterium]
MNNSGRRSPIRPPLALSLRRGQYIDDTSLYYMNARYYDPEIGQFLSPAPSGLPPRAGPKQSV